MKIHVNRVPEGGGEQHAAYDPRTMDMDRQDVHPDQPCEVDAFILSVDRELIVQAQIRCLLHLSCARCLEAYDSTVQGKATFRYAVQPTDVVDLTEDIRQEIILLYPIVPICQPTCQGLCPRCGQNLNAGSCPHHKE